MKVLIVGGNGQLGTTLNKCAPSKIGADLVEVFSITRKDLDLCDAKACEEIVQRIKPDFLINAAAYTFVDLAETNSNIAFAVNAHAPRAFAEALKHTGGKLIYFSTDYVFDGKNPEPYKTFDMKKPINIYGKSKAAGEDYLLETLEKSKQCFIIRTSWLISEYGNNFLLIMLKLLSEKSQIAVISDQVASPTSAWSLATACWALIKRIYNNNKYTTILHWTDSGIASWYDLAQAISEYGKELGLLVNPANITPIKTTEFGSVASRPLYSVLDTSSSLSFLDENNTYWRNSLKQLLVNTLHS
tara:strand:- start:810 stop:1712 length:903 start_codon:yes stop_codon:yes gene_type:complete